MVGVSELTGNETFSYIIFFSFFLYEKYYKNTWMFLTTRLLHIHLNSYPYRIEHGPKRHTLRVLRIK
jgi:hypothetical protein